MVRIYNFGKNGRPELAIVTDCATEEEFVRKAAEAFVMNETEDLAQFIVRSCDIICKLRGYKNDVKERRLLLAGEVWPADGELAAHENRAIAEEADA